MEAKNIFCTDKAQIGAKNIEITKFKTGGSVPTGNTRVNGADIAKMVRDYVKMNYPNCKFSITSSYNGCDISLINADFEPFIDVNDESLKKGRAISIFSFDTNDAGLSPEGFKLFKDLSDLTDGYSFNYNEGNPNADKVDYNLYINFYVGKWDKPFELVPSKGTQIKKPNVNPANIIYKDYQPFVFSYIAKEAPERYIMDELIKEYKIVIPSKTDVSGLDIQASNGEYCNLSFFKSFISVITPAENKRVIINPDDTLEVVLKQLIEEFNEILASNAANSNLLYLDVSPFDFDNNPRPEVETAILDAVKVKSIDLLVDSKGTLLIDALILPQEITYRVEIKFFVNKVSISAPLFGYYTEIFADVDTKLQYVISEIEKELDKIKKISEDNSAPVVIDFNYEAPYDFKSPRAIEESIIYWLGEKGFTHIQPNSPYILAVDLGKYSFKLKFASNGLRIEDYPDAGVSMKESILDYKEETVQSLVDRIHHACASLTGLIDFEKEAPYNFESPRAIEDSIVYWLGEKGFKNIDPESKTILRVDWVNNVYFSLHFDDRECKIGYVSGFNAVPKIKLLDYEEETVQSFVDRIHHACISLTVNVIVPYKYQVSQKPYIELMILDFENPRLDVEAVILAYVDAMAGNPPELWNERSFTVTFKANRGIEHIYLISFWDDSTVKIYRQNGTFGEESRKFDKQTKKLSDVLLFISDSIAKIADGNIIGKVYPSELAVEDKVNDYLNNGFPSPEGTATPSAFTTPIKKSAYIGELDFLSPRTDVETYLQNELSDKWYKEIFINGFVYTTSETNILKFAGDAPSVDVEVEFKKDFETIYFYKGNSRLATSSMGTAGLDTLDEVVDEVIKHLKENYVTYAGTTTVSSSLGNELYENIQAEFKDNETNKYKEYVTDFFESRNVTVNSFPDALLRISSGVDAPIWFVTTPKVLTDNGNADIVNDIKGVTLDTILYNAIDEINRILKGVDGFIAIPVNPISKPTIGSYLYEELAPIDFKKLQPSQVVNHILDFFNSRGIKTDGNNSVDGELILLTDYRIRFDFLRADSVKMSIATTVPQVETRYYQQQETLDEVLFDLVETINTFFKSLQLNGNKDLIPLLPLVSTSAPAPSAKTTSNERLAAYLPLDFENPRADIEDEIIASIKRNFPYEVSVKPHSTSNSLWISSPSFDEDGYYLDCSDDEIEISNSSSDVIASLSRLFFGLLTSSMLGSVIVTKIVMYETNKKVSLYDYFPLDLENKRNIELNFIAALDAFKGVVDDIMLKVSFDSVIIRSKTLSEEYVLSTTYPYLGTSSPKYDRGVQMTICTDSKCIKEITNDDLKSMSTSYELADAIISTILENEGITLLGSNVISTVSGRTIGELTSEYEDLMFLASITPIMEVEAVTSLRQKADSVKKELNTVYIQNEAALKSEVEMFDIFFEQSSISPKNRYGDLKPYSDGFAPNGQPTALPKKIYDISLSDDFEQWFGNYQASYQFKDSKFEQPPCSVVVTENYEPRIVWHGSGAEFSYFKFDSFPAMYFAENYYYANWFAEQKGAGEGYVYPFLLNIKNPLDLTHFGIDRISYDEFADWVFLQTGLEPESLKVNPALMNPNDRHAAWMFLRNSTDMLQMFRDTKLFDGIVYHEDNPPINPAANNYRTKAYIIFEAENAKIADPERGSVLFSGMRSFYLKRGGKL